MEPKKNVEMVLRRVKTMNEKQREKAQKLDRILGIIGIVLSAGGIFIILIALLLFLFALPWLLS